MPIRLALRDVAGVPLRAPYASREVRLRAAFWRTGLSEAASRKGSRTPARRAHQPARSGVVFAAIALLLQIAVPSLHRPSQIGSQNGARALFVNFDEHALCLTQHSTAPDSPAPADKAPKVEHDFAACCMWHGAAGAVLASAARVEPVVFAAFIVAFTAPQAGIPTRLSGAARARAPPAGA